MSLEKYFDSLLQKVEQSDIQNNGKDSNGFYSPTRTLLLRHLGLLKDLHGKPLARSMLQGSWKFVVEHLPPEWLILTAPEKAELKQMLEPSPKKEGAPPKP